MTLRGRCIAAGFILLLIIRTPVKGQERAYELESAGLREYNAGNLKAAEESFMQGLQLAVTAGNKGLEAAINNDLGNTEVSADRLERAYEAYTRALTIFRSMPGKQQETAVLFVNVAAADAQLGKYDQSQHFLKEARKILLPMATSADAQALLAETLNIQGMILMRQENFSKAQTAFEEAVRSRTAAGLPEGLGDAQALSNIGMIDIKKHKDKEAESAFLKSMDIMNRKLGPSHPDITLTLLGLGEAYMAMGRYEDANAQFQRSLTILRGLNPPLYSRIVLTLGMAAVNDLKQGNETSAGRSFQEAVQIARSAAVDDPALPGILDKYADLLQKQGRAKDAKGLRADARRIRLTSAFTVRLKGTE